MSLTTTSEAVRLDQMPPLRTKTLMDRWAPWALGLLGAVVMLINLSRFPRLEDDEGTYVGQADAILHGLVTPYTYTYDHPYGAWGQMAPLYEIVKWFGFGNVSAIFMGRLVMVMFAFCTIALIYKIARRIELTVPFAVTAALIWITSGLIHDDARAVYLDNVAIMWVLLALYLAMSPRQHMWHYMASGGALGVAVLSKETMAVFAPAILLAMWKSSWKRLRGMHVAVFIVSATLVGLSYPLYAALKSELLPSSERSSLMSMLYWQMSGRDGSGSFWDATSLRRQVINDWLYYDRWLVIAGVVAALICLFNKRTRIIGVAVAGGLVPVVVMSGYLPSMYHLALDPFLAIAVAAVLSMLALPIARWRRTGGKVSGTKAIAGGLALASVVALAAVYVMPVRVSRLSDAFTQNGVGQFYEARAWVLDNIPEGDVVVTNGEIWNDLTEAGWSTDEAIPYTKLDRDPTYSKTVPEWIVMTPTLTRDVSTDPSAVRFKDYFFSAVPVATFGDYTILKVPQGATA